MTFCNTAVNRVAESSYFWLNEFNAVEGGTASLLDATHTCRTKS